MVDNNNNNNGYNMDEFVHQLDGNIQQSMLGKEVFRHYRRNKDRFGIELARVLKVNYKYNTAEVVTTLHKEPFVKGYDTHGKFSARIPDDFSGVTPNGNTYGTVKPLTVGSLVAIAFLRGEVDSPIILGSFSDNNVAKKLARTEFVAADERDEDLQRELWQHFQLYPSLTYKNIDGKGNIQETYSGRSFKYINGEDPENSTVQDYGFNYEHLPDSAYNDGAGQIEPVNPNFPTSLEVFQGVYDKQKVTFFIKGDGTVRYATRHINAPDTEGITYHELMPTGGYRVAQQRTDGNPEFFDEIERKDKSSFELTDDGDFEVHAGTMSLKVTTDGQVLIDDMEIDPVAIDERFDRTERNLTGANESIRIIDGVIRLQAEKIEEVDDAVVKNIGRLEVESGRIDGRVRRDEFDTLAKGTDNILVGSAFLDSDLPEGYTEDTTLQVIQSEDNPNEIIVTAGVEYEEGEDEVTGIYMSRQAPMDMQATFPYTLSFEVVGLGEEESLTFDYMRLAYDVEIIENEEVVGIERNFLPLDNITVSNPIKEDGTIEEKVMAELLFNAPLEAEDHDLYVLIGTSKATSESFHITKPMVNQGSGRKEWNPSYREFEVVKRTESSITLLYNELELKVSEDDFNGNEIVSRITLVPGAIDLLADEITITADLVKFMDLSGDNGTTFINGGNIITDTMSWDVGYGGELTLGGQNDQNGMFQVLTAEGEVKVRFDANDGGADIFTVGHLYADNKLETNTADQGGNLYVHAQDGDDDRSGTSWTNSLASVEGALMKIPRNNNATWNIYINTGHTIYETIEVRGYTGGGIINISPVPEATTKAKIEGRIVVSGCGHEINLTNLDVNTTSNYGAIEVYHSHHVTVDYCKIDCNDASFAVGYLTGSSGRVRNTEMNGSNIAAVRASYAANVFASNNSGTGNAISLNPLGGVIIATGTQPDGGGLPTNGGVIHGTPTYQQAAPPPSTPSRSTTQTFSASSTGSWRTSGGWRTDNSFVYQGQYGFGLHRGLWFFGNSIYNAVNGRSIQRIEIRPSRRAEGGITGSVGAVVRTHNHPSRPGGQPSLSSNSQTFGFRWGDRKWVTLKSALYSDFSSGGARGLGVYTASTSRSLYMIFNTAMQVRITYS